MKGKKKLPPLPITLPPIQEKRKRFSVGKFLLVIFILFLLLPVFAPISKQGLQEKKKTVAEPTNIIPVYQAKERVPDKIDAWTMAQVFIERRLKSPSTADYGFAAQDTDKCVENLGNNEFRIKGWVDSQNSFGATCRTDFLLTIKYVGNDEWRLTETPIMIQR